MKKCTLCIDRIYNETFDPRRPRAGLRRRPARLGARHFGDLGDPESAVSQLVAERGGYDLMPEMGYAPTNKYLPPRAAQDRARLTRRARGARAGGEAEPAACCAGSTAVRRGLIPMRASRPFGHLLHHASGAG